MKLLSTLLLSMLLMGCTAAQLNPPPEYYKAQETVAVEVADVERQPLLEITGKFECAESPCSIKVYNPDTSKIPRIDRGTSGADVAIATVKAATSIAKIGVGGLVISRAIRNAGDEQYNINSDNGANVSIERGNVDVTEVDGDISVVGDTNTSTVTETSTNSYSDNDTSTVTTNRTTTTIGDYSGDSSGRVGNNSGAQSGNGGDVIDDNRGRIDSDNDHDSTRQQTVIKRSLVVQP